MRCRNTGLIVLTWLVLLEFLEWPCSPPACVIRFGCGCTAFGCCNPNWLHIESVSEQFSGSDNSEMPESVTMEEMNEAGSISPPAKISFVFFLVNEPKPDEPDAMEESSRKPVVVVRDPVVAGSPGNGAACWLTLTTLPKSSSDGIFLLFEFDVGL